MVGLEPSTAKAPRSEIRDPKLTNYETGINENGLSETDFARPDRSFRLQIV